ncbi:MAG: hypothetical protein Q8Q09_16380 [Deltaproteobacteria bacterium]|nr:hypothetical protein [Deltaproteobacteria bacterium]
MNERSLAIVCVALATLLPQWAAAQARPVDRPAVPPPDGEPETSTPTVPAVPPDTSEPTGTDETDTPAGGGNGGGAPRPADDIAESREQPLTDEQRAQMVTSLGELPSGVDRAPRRFVFPPYLREWGPEHDTTVLFPLYFRSRVRESQWLFIPPYFQLRSPTANTDVVFPFFFRFNGTRSDTSRYSTTVIPPVWVHQSRGPGLARTSAYGAFPLFSYHESFSADGRLEGEHLVIPAALTYHRWFRGGQHTITPFFQYVRSGSSTTWTAGPVVPLVAHHHSPSLDWTLVWPLAFFHRHERETNARLTVVGPFWTSSTPTSVSVNFAPIFFHSHDRTSSRTTVLPLFHTEWSREHFTLITPLAGYTRVGNESTLITPLYQNHRGATQLDAIAPFFYYGRDPRLGTSTLQVLNFVHNRRPTGYSWTFFPLIGRIHEEGRFDTTITPLFAHSNNQTQRSTTTWVFPNIHVERSPEHRVVNVYPFWFSAAGRGWHHNVFFPFVWDIGNRTEGRQVTVIAPFYAHSGDRTGYTRWAFPDVFWWRHGSGETLSWGYDIAPFFQYAEPHPGDYSWTVLYGLAGHRRQGSYEQTRVFWATIDHSAPPGTVTQRRASTTAPRTRDTLLDL